MVDRGQHEACSLGQAWSLDGVDTHTFVQHKDCGYVACEWNPLGLTVPELQHIAVRKAGWRQIMESNNFLDQSAIIVLPRTQSDRSRSSRLTSSVFGPS